VANVHRDPESCSDVIVTVVPLHILAVSLCTELNIPFIHLETVETQAGHPLTSRSCVEKENTSIYRFQQQQKLHETQAEAQCCLGLNDRVTIVTTTINTFSVWLCRFLSLDRHHAFREGQPGSLHTTIASKPGPKYL
jgi:hypothetical protein